MSRSLWMLSVWLGAVVAGGAGCAAEGRQRITLHDSRGTEVGTVTVEPSAVSGVSFTFDLRGLPPGEHAVHLHQVAKCDAPSFESAGPHLNPSQKQHGLENPLGPHDGDMSDLTVAADGTAKGTIDNSRVTLGPGEGSLGALGGVALVVHAQPDDMKSDPAGNAGDRIACGVIAAP